MSERAPAPPVSRRRKPVLPILLIVVVVLGIIVWRFTVSNSKATDNNIVALSGRIEGDDSAIAPKTSGRILEIRFREGDTVKAGETIAVLDDAQLRAREEQAQAGLSVSEARERAARSQLAALQDQLEQSQVQTGQARMD